jgi:hypothetical protein
LQGGLFISYQLSLSMSSRRFGNAVSENNVRPSRLTTTAGLEAPGYRVFSGFQGDLIFGVHLSDRGTFGAVKNLGVNIPDVS